MKKTYYVVIKLCENMKANLMKKDKNKENEKRIISLKHLIYGYVEHIKDLDTKKRFDKSYIKDMTKYLSLDIRYLKKEIQRYKLSFGEENLKKMKECEKRLENSEKHLKLLKTNSDAYFDLEIKEYEEYLNFCTEQLKDLRKLRINLQAS